MASPVFDKQHIREYLLYGSLAATAYIIPVVIFLYNNSYQNLYYLFIGCAFFMAVIFMYGYQLLFKKYDKKRAVSMLIAGLLATLCGILIAIILVFISMLFFNAKLSTRFPIDQILPGAGSQHDVNTPGYLLAMILATSIIGNFAVGSFISVIVSYAGKRDQTKDKPVDITGPQTVERPQ